MNYEISINHDLFVCDFFSGLHSWTKVIDDPKVKIFSIDNNQDYESNTTIIDDFLNLTSKQVIDYFGSKPHIIYASPPCTTFRWLRLERIGLEVTRHIFLNLINQRLLLRLLNICKID